MFQLIHQSFFGWKLGKVNSDWLCNKLVYKLLTNLEILFAIYASYFFYNGNPIQCKSMDLTETTFCWNSDMYVYERPSIEDIEAGKYKPAATYPGIYGKGGLFTEIYPGIRLATEPPSERTYLFQMRWLPAFFILFAAMSILPRGMWLYLQKRMLVNVIRDVSKPSISIEVQDRVAVECGERFAHNMREHYTLCYRYQFVQYLNLLSLASQFAIIVFVYGGGDIFYGYNLMTYQFTPYNNWPIDLIKSLPKQAICETTHFGVGAEIEIRDSICTLSGNATFQIMLSVLSVVIATCFLLVLWSFLGGFLFMYWRRFRLFVVRSTLNIEPEAPSMKVIESLNKGSCFLVLLMEKNMDKDILCQILYHVSMELRNNAVEVKKKYFGLM